MARTYGRPVVVPRIHKRDDTWPGLLWVAFLSSWHSSWAPLWPVREPDWDRRGRQGAHEVKQRMGRPERNKKDTEMSRLSAEPRPGHVRDCFKIEKITGRYIRWVGAWVGEI